MGFYSTQVFPRLMDWAMSGLEFQRLRTALLHNAQGEVLEIGFGTGLNLPHYPHTLSSLSIIDPAQMLPRTVTARVAAAPFPVRCVYRTAETLPFDNRQFDCVVSTWTLCTIADPVRALREVRRVLKSTGRLLFLEHGRSDDPKTAAWQDRLNPIQKVIGCGCNLNRPIDRFITEAGLHIVQLDRFVMEGIPRIGGELYRGVATPDPATVNAPSETNGR